MEIGANEDWIAKLRAACAARRSADFVIIVRTDSRAVAGFAEAVARANATLEAGATSPSWKRRSPWRKWPQCRRWCAAPAC
ncbi:MAG: isocitrate lyase/phosphoenolpyruvate mutase family protein [Rhodospirillales bacterium]|nr:isocitrate lyase/phosphoenolpyruvate mutase family protein [Rhodospirillales bacterium]